MNSVRTSDMELVYLNYWKRKQLMRNPPDFAIRRHWWDTNDFSEIQEVMFEAIRDAKSVLDVGAGDMRFRDLARKRAFQGEYDTQDIGTEYEYTYSDLSQVHRTYDAIVCTDVLEHLPLADGLALLHRLLELLNSRGVLALQTANANFHRSPLAWDMTHLHVYNPRCLWSYLTALGTQATIYRVMFGHPPRGMKPRVHEWIRAWLATELHLDYCQNLVAIVRKSI